MASDDLPEDEEWETWETLYFRINRKLKEAEKLALAEAMGALSLALRGVGDDEIVVDETASVGDTTETVTDIKISKVMQKVIGNENNTGIRAPIVRIYNGSSVDEVSVRPYINP